MGNQFTEFGTPKHTGLADKASTTVVGWRSTQDLAADARRRVERNYSDLFGAASGPLSPRSRADMDSAANATFLDAFTEIASRNAARRRGADATPQSQGDGAGVAAVLPLPTPRECKRDAESKKTSAQERACWDVLPHGGMGIGVEVARRRRDARLSRSGAAQSPSEPTASDRKRADMASGQLRLGMGAPNEPHDDGRAASWTVPGSPRSVVQPSNSPTARMRSVVGSPIVRSSPFLHQPPPSARARKIQSLMSSTTF